MPATDESDNLMHELFPDMGDGSRVTIPLSGVRFNKVKIGKRVIIQANCLMMAAGGITLEDDVLIAANVQLISNNHDLEDRMVITCKPVRICRRHGLVRGLLYCPGLLSGKMRLSAQEAL